MYIDGYLRPIENTIETIECMLDDMKYAASADQNTALGSYIKSLESKLATFKTAVKSPPVQIKNQNQEPTFKQPFKEIRF